MKYRIYNLTESDHSFISDLESHFACKSLKNFGFSENSIYFISEKNSKYAEHLKTHLKNSFVFLILPKEDLKNTILEINPYIDGYFIDGHQDNAAKIKILLSSLNNCPLSDLYKETYKTTLKISREKNQKLNQLSEALNGFPKINERLKMFIINTLDELLLNAIYDAPLDLSSKKYTLKNISRDAILILDKPVDLEIVVSENFLALSVTDYYGSFDYDTLNKSLAKNNQNDKYKPIDDSISLGGGLGLSLSFNRGASLSFFSESNKLTRTIAYFPLYREYKEFRKHEKFLLNLLHKK